MEGASTLPPRGQKATVQNHRLGIDISVKSLAVWKWWILKRTNIKSLIEEQPYRLIVRFRNLADQDLPKGNIDLVVLWASGRKSYWTLEIPFLRRGEECETHSIRQDRVGSEGLALMYCYSLNIGDQKTATLWDMSGTERYEATETARHAITGFFCTTWMDLYTRYGVLISAASLAIIALEKIAELFGWATRLLLDP